MNSTRPFFAPLEVKQKLQTPVNYFHMKYYKIVCSMFGNLILSYVSLKIEAAAECHISWTFSVIGNCNFSTLLKSMAHFVGCVSEVSSQGCLLLYISYLL